MTPQVELNPTTAEANDASPLRLWWAALPQDRQRDLWLRMSDYDLREIAPDLPPLKDRDREYLDALTAKSMINVQRTEAWINACRSKLPAIHRKTFTPVVSKLRDFALGAFRLDLVDRLVLACDPEERRYRLAVVVNREPPMGTMEMTSDVGYNILQELMKLARRKGRSTSTIYPRIVLKVATEGLTDEEITKRITEPGVLYLGSPDRVPTVRIIKTEKALQRALRKAAGEQE